MVALELRRRRFEKDAEEGRTKRGQADAEGAEATGAPSTAASINSGDRERAGRRRGTTCVVVGLFHGQDAAGSLCVGEGVESEDGNARIAYGGGFDKWSKAVDVQEARFGFRTIEAEADDVFEDDTRLPEGDLVTTGSPCVRASWAPYKARGGGRPPDGNHPTNQLYWRQVPVAMRKGKAVVMEFPLSVLSLEGATGEPPGFLQERAENIMHAGEWTTHRWPFNANFHGGATGRRRLYTLGFAPEVVAAATRAGIEVGPQPEPMPLSERITLGDVLFDEDIIRAHHPGTSTIFRVQPRQLSGDRTEEAEAARVDTGLYEPEPVSDARLPGIPLKCYAGMPLVMLEDGAIRRMAPGEFAAAGGVNGAVGFDMPTEPSAEEQKEWKVLVGNTWDGAITRIVMREAVRYMQPYLRERQDELATLHRSAAIFNTIVARLVLPARRAWRKWKEHARSGAGGGGFSGASVFVVCQHGALMGCAGGIWQDFGGRRDGNETPYETAFRELHEEIGLTASHIDVLPDQPLWVVHAGYRHAVYVATLSEANRLRPDWELGDELDSYRNDFVDFANFFADDMVGSELVHRRIKNREIFDLASSAYANLRRTARRGDQERSGSAGAPDDDDGDGGGDSGAPGAGAAKRGGGRGAEAKDAREEEDEGYDVGDSGADADGGAECESATGVTASGSIRLTARLESAMSGGGMRFTKCVEVDEEGHPDIRRRQTDKRWNVQLDLEAGDLKAMHQRGYPQVAQAPETDPLPEPKTPTDGEQRAFMEAHPTEKSCYTDTGWKMINEYDYKMQEDATRASGRGDAQGRRQEPRMKSGRKGSEFRILPIHHAATARGKLVTIGDDGRPRLTVPVPVEHRMQRNGGAVKIEFGRIADFIIRTKHHDREMLSLCSWGWSDKTDKRPFVTSLSPNQKMAYEHYDLTCEAHDAEVEKGWQKLCKGRPFAVTMHVTQTNLRVKPNGTGRLLGNATHPEPGTLQDTFEGRLIAPNANTDWELIPAYVWASIETFAMAGAVMAARIIFIVNGPHGEHARRVLYIVGDRDDLTKWFRQIPLATLDQHKQVYHWDGRWKVDTHVQMGRGSSADGAQRLSMVARLIVVERVEQRVQQYVASDTSAVGDALRWYMRLYRADTGAEESGLWFIDVMQDDMAWMAVAKEIGDIVREQLPIVMAEYGIEVSLEKRAEDERAIPGPHPARTMMYIGGYFDFVDMAQAVVRGQDKTIERFNEIVNEFSEKRPGTLVNKVMYQSAIGMGMFHGRFVDRARRRLNRGIAQIRGRRGDFAVVSKGWLDDITSLRDEAVARQGAPLVRPTHWEHPGLLGMNSDASRPSGRDGDEVERGFGGNAMHSYFYGSWTEEEAAKLDISTLELLGVVFLVVIAAITGTATPRMVIRCDNEAACRVINNHCAAKPQMIAALLHLENAQRTFGIELLAHHIAGEDNKIADDLSRGRIREAVARLRALAAGAEPAEVAIPAEWRDISQVVRAAKR